MRRERGKLREREGEREREGGRQETQVTKKRKGSGRGCKLQSTKFAAAP